MSSRTLRAILCLGCVKARNWCMLSKRGAMRLRQIARKLQAIAALFALLLASVPALAESLSTFNLPACCNTVYCPVHHRQVSQAQKDASNCAAQGNSMRNDCSMRACDTASPVLVGTAVYVLTAPLAIRTPASAEAARIQAPRFSPFVVSIPLTPPPRTLPS